jgi:hypothetical protein
VSSANAWAERCRCPFAFLLVGCGSVGELLGVVTTDSGASDVGMAESGGGPEASLEAEAEAQTSAADAEGGDDAGDAALPCDPSKPFGPPLAVAGLQSSADEGGFRLLPDELSGFFWSSRAGGPGTANLYVTTRPNTTASFGNVKLLSNVNVAGTFQLDPSVTGNGLTLAFRSDREGGAGDDLYSATRTNVGANFSAVTLLASLNSSSNDVQPFLIPDGSEIYYASNRTGDYQIYRATGSAGTYGAPTPVTELNQSGVGDTNPVASADDLNVLFSSTRSGGSGMDDIWMATRPTRALPFGTPVNVAEVNSTGNDDPTWLSIDGCRLYMSRGGNGSTHVYLATRPQ